MTPGEKITNANANACGQRDQNGRVVTPRGSRSSTALQDKMALNADTTCTAHPRSGPKLLRLNIRWVHSQEYKQSTPGELEHTKEGAKPHKSQQHDNTKELKLSATTPNSSYADCRTRIHGFGKAKAERRGEWWGLGSR